jgi:hypothetical protein
MKYDVVAFHVWNYEIRRSIKEYDRIPKKYPPKMMQIHPLNLKPKARVSPETGTRICAEVGCYEVLTHLRSRLCEHHRETRYQAGKRGRS